LREAAVASKSAGSFQKTQAYQQMAQAQSLVPEEALDDREELKDYKLSVVGYSVYATLMERNAATGVERDEPLTDAAAALDAIEETPEERQQRASALVWTQALGDATVLALAEMHEGFGQPEYRRLLRDIIQGAMSAAKELKFPLREAAKLVFGFLMTVCPHEDRVSAVRYLAKTLAYEIMLCKLSLGMAMKMTAYALGEAVFRLAISDVVQGRTDGPFSNPHHLLDAVGEGVWDATELIVPGSLVHLRDNGLYVVRGFSDSETRLRSGLVTNGVERVLSLPVIGWVYRPMRWMVLVAYNRLKNSPIVKKVWDKLME
jgi:hypothetical protein